MLVPFDPSFFETAQADAQDQSVTDNILLRYLHKQSPESLSQIAQSVSPEVQQMIAGNVQGLMGALPHGQFQIQVSTSRENLSGLLASAMMTGYFLRKVEQRMELEQQFATLGGEEIPE
ncbi:MAG: DUF760 domain-containing protein [Gemmatimonadaceae bacterium]|nr:DUF760 domain-containing protein [Gloeobacterales cyanobacterium ES-bin-141]